MGYLDYLQHGRKLLFKRGELPVYLVYFITDACNAKCKHCLLADGAHPVLRVEDVLEELERLPRLEGPPRLEDAQPLSSDAMRADPRGDLRRRLRAALGKAPRAPEALAEELGEPLGLVLATLTELELLGLARACPGQRYALPPPPEKKEEGRGGAAKGGG